MVVRAVQLRINLGGPKQGRKRLLNPPAGEQSGAEIKMDLRVARIEIARPVQMDNGF